MSRIVMAMSGGVDSSVAAALLCEAGHDVIGVFMRHGEPETAACRSGDDSRSSALPIITSRLDHKQGCCTASDAADGRRVADQLGIPFYALELSDDFARIMDYFVAEYTAARTPNPCIVCNNWLKFGKLFEYADSVGAEFVATGHYARIEKAEGGRRKAELAGTPRLLRGVDADKDQSYVLFGVARKYLSRMLLPIGHFRKAEIRERARALGMRVADKRDSQEICFVSSGDHAEFVRDRRAGGGNSDNFSGDIVLADGEIVGHHAGIEAFTIGQRKGLRVAMGEPYYVTRIELDSRRVVIGPREELARRELTFDRANWLIEAPPQAFSATVQVRYNSDAVPAQVEPLADGRFRVVFDESQYGIAPGQAAVCYDGDQVLGGGWIE